MSEPAGSFWNTRPFSDRKRQSAGIGTFYLCKDETGRQEFLANRFRRREILPRRRVAELRLEEARKALEPLMGVLAALGHLPDPSSLPSHRKSSSVSVR